jgi:hypothetical protein
MKTTYKLAIADRMFSCWSLRGWLSFVHFDIPVTVQHYPILTPRFDVDKKQEFSPAIKMDHDATI